MSVIKFLGMLWGYSLSGLWTPFVLDSHIHSKLGQNALSPLQTTINVTCCSTNNWTSEAYSAVEVYPSFCTTVISLWICLFHFDGSLSLSPILHEFLLWGLFYAPPCLQLHPNSCLSSPYSLIWLPSHLLNCLPGQNFTEAAPSWTQMCICFVSQFLTYMKPKNFISKNFLSSHRVCLKWVIVFQCHLGGM